jgi:hypothetical protein
MFCNYQLVIVGVVLLCIGYLVIYGSSSTTIQETFVGAAVASSTCAAKCKAAGYCCNDITEGSNQYLSCAQGCYMAEAEAAASGALDVNTCKSKCSAQGASRGCAYQDGDVSFQSLCGVCSDFVPKAQGSNQSNNPKCAFSGAGTGASCAAGCALASGSVSCGPNQPRQYKMVAANQSCNWAHAARGSQGPAIAIQKGSLQDVQKLCDQTPGCDYVDYVYSQWEKDNYGYGDLWGTGKCPSSGWGKNTARKIYQAVPNPPCPNPPPPANCSSFLGGNSCPSGTTAKPANTSCAGAPPANFPGKGGGACRTRKNGEVWCFDEAGSGLTGNQLCGQPAGYSGPYYGLDAAAAAEILPGYKFYGVGDGISDNVVAHWPDHSEDCMSNYFEAAPGNQIYGNGANVQGSGGSVCSGSAAAWSRDLGDMGAIVRCATLEKGIGCGAQTCCTANPQCSSLGACPAKTTMTEPSKVCAGSPCSIGECCPPNPVCTSSICNAQTQVFIGANVICDELTCTAGECCENRAQCSSLTCDPAKYDSKPGGTYCAGPVCSVSECCIPDPTCGNYQCPVGTYHPKPNEAGIKCGVNQSCDTDDCCDLNPTCAGFSPCPVDEHLKKTAPNIRCKTAVCNSTECCGWNPKCSTMVCPEDDFYWAYSHIPNASNVFCDTEVCTEKQCCVATPTGNLPKVQTYPLFP